MNRRQTQLTELINSAGRVTFRELKDSFPDVSEMTIRRDLIYLDQLHKIVRTYGGAKSIRDAVGTDDVFSKRAVVNIENKRLIARKAVSLITPNSAIYVDSGTTMTEFAKLIPDIPLIIFTGSLSVGIELARLTLPEIKMFGGTLNKRSYCESGTRGLEYVDTINFNCAFLGTTGYTDERGFNCGDENENILKKRIMEKSDINIVLMDTSKVGISTAYTFAMPDNINIVVSDGNLPKKQMELFEKSGIHVL